MPRHSNSSKKFIAVYLFEQAKVKNVAQCPLNFMLTFFYARVDWF